jgi:hypothetical protein
MTIQTVADTPRPPMFAIVDSMPTIGVHAQGKNATLAGAEALKSLGKFADTPSTTLATGMEQMGTNTPFRDPSAPSKAPEYSGPGATPDKTSSTANIASR